MMNELNKNDLKFNEDGTDEKSLENPLKLQLVWRNILIMSTIHIMAVYGLYLCFTKAMWSTIIFAYCLGFATNVGVTAGVHRLWSHKAYKVKLPLKLLLLLLFTMSYQSTVYNWARDHRVHHKYSDTNADPHNASRGFFFCHIGWLLVKKHPDVIKKGRTIDISDIENDPLLKIQKKYFYLWVFLFAVAIPAYIPTLWGEDLSTAFYVAVALRYTYVLHMIFLVNSAAHTWGYKPYDKDIRPAQNKVVSFLATGEGFHNYHHTFPWDYRSSEWGDYTLNASLLFIDLMAKIGWAYDLKAVSEELIEKRVMRTGDGSHPVWGWNDKDLTEEYKQSANVLYSSKVSG